jgi:L-fucose isomerase-like protein
MGIGGQNPFAQAYHQCKRRDAMNRETKFGVLFLGRKRPGFDPEWGKEVQRSVRDFLKKNRYDCVIPSDNIADDADLREAVESCRRAGARTLVVTQPTVSDGRLAPLLAQLWRDPLIFWATTEKQTGEMISANSLVGTHIFASLFRQMRHPFELVYGHPGEEQTKVQLDLALSLIGAALSLQNAKVGLIGQHAPGFVNLAVDPDLLWSALGVQLHHMSLHEFLSVFESAGPEEVAEDVEAFKKLGIPLKDVEEADLDTASRFYLAFRRVMAAEHLDALATRCWPEMPNITGQWPYVAISRMLSEQAAIAQEGDVDGAVMALAARELGMGQVYMSDWLEHDASSIAIWHTGCVPLELCEPIGSDKGPRVALHFNIRKPAVIEATLRADLPITIFRLWNCDGRYNLTALEGRTAPPRRHLLGNNGIAEIQGVDVREWFDDMIHMGLPHHVQVARGNHRGRLKRFARQAGIRFI